MKPALRQPQRLRRLAIGGTVLLALLATASLYSAPDFLLQLTQQLWFCFQ